jgi:chaperonin GroES
MTKFKPLGERVLAKIVEREEQTASGIVLPDTAREKPRTAEVLALGDLDGVKLEVGEVIIFAKFSGTEMKLDGEDLLVLDAEDVLGIVEG